MRWISAVVLLSVAACADGPVAPPAGSAQAEYAEVVSKLRSAPELMLVASMDTATFNPTEAVVLIDQLYARLPLGRLDQLRQACLAEADNGISLASSPDACFWQHMELLAAESALIAGGIACKFGTGPAKIAACMALPALAFGVAHAAQHMQECYCKKGLAPPRYCGDSDEEVLPEPERRKNSAVIPWMR